MLAKMGFDTGRHVEFLILSSPRPDGPVVGFFQNHPIAAAVVDYFGRRYVYAGVAPRRRNGRYDIDVLARDERLVEPGLIYRYIATEGSAG